MIIAAGATAPTLAEDAGAEPGFVGAAIFAAIGFVAKLVVVRGVTPAIDDDFYLKDEGDAKVSGFAQRPGFGSGPRLHAYDSYVQPSPGFH